MWLSYPILFRYRMTESLPSGYPIRLSRARRICAPPPGLSQLITAFFASQLLGIHHTPIIRLTILSFRLRILFRAELLSNSAIHRAVQAFASCCHFEKLHSAGFPGLYVATSFPVTRVSRKLLFRLRIPSLFEISLKALASFENLRPVKEP